MLRLKIRKSNKEWFLIGVFYLLLLQTPISQHIPIFSYTEEAFSLLGICVILIGCIQSGRMTIKRSNMKIVVLLLIFFAVGIFANFRYGYQQFSLVLVDILTNFKFFLSIVSGYVIFRWCSSEQCERTLVSHARTASLILFVLVILDYMFQIFPSAETRYGIRTVQLLYGHATYLAGAAVFLITILTSIYEKRNNIYIIFSLVILCATLRGKAIAGAIIYIVLFYFLMINKQKLKVWHFVLIGLTAVLIAWEQLVFYYVELEGQSARSVMTLTSFEIMRDYFPIGTGFGTYASHSAAVNYSPVYVQYGFLEYQELGGNQYGAGFFDDTFWPIIIGQTGAIGLVCYVSVLILLFRKIQKVRKTNMSAYTACIFVFIYLLISSTSEPAFNNSIAAPMAMMLGYAFWQMDRTEKSRKANTLQMHTAGEQGML